jgi:hypothetical protein
MNRLIAAAFGIALLGTGAAFQDAPPAAAAPSDAKELLKKGLEASVEAGGFTFTGSVDQDSPFAGAAMAIGAPMLSVGPDGRVSGTLGADGLAHVRIEKDKNVYEIFRKGSKIVNRQVWKGTQMASGSFASEAGAVLNLARLAKAGGKAKDAKKEEGTKKGGDVECVVIRATLSTDIIDDESEPAVAGFDFKMFELKRIESKFYLGKDDNLLRKVELKFVKGFNAMIAGAMPGGGGDEEEGEEDEGAPVKKSFSTTIKLTLGAYSKTAAVTVPEDVKTLLQD